MCGMCPELFASLDELTAHHRVAHPKTPNFSIIKSAHNGSCQVYKYIFKEKLVMFPRALTVAFRKVRRLVKRLLAEKKAFKGALVFTLRFRKASEEVMSGARDETGGATTERDLRHGFEGRDVITVNIRSNSEFFVLHGDNEVSLERLESKVLKTFDEFVRHGSGWSLVDCLSVDFDVGHCHPLRGSLSSCEILHVSSARKQQGLCISDQNGHRHAPHLCAQVMREGDRCFYYCIAAHMMIGDQLRTNPNLTPDKIPSADEMEYFLSQNDVREVPSPVDVKSIKLFEDLNPHLDVAINVVFKDEKGALFPCLASKKLTAKHVINLQLFFTKVEGHAASKVSFSYSFPI